MAVCGYLSPHDKNNANGIVPIVNTFVDNPLSVAVCGYFSFHDKKKHKSANIETHTGRAGSNAMPEDVPRPHTNHTKRMGLHRPFTSSSAKHPRRAPTNLNTSQFHPSQVSTGHMGAHARALHTLHPYRKNSHKGHTDGGRTGIKGDTIDAFVKVCTSRLHHQH